MKLISILPLLFIFACQPADRIREVVFDNNQLSKLNILSNVIEIKITFEKKISDPFIGYTLKTDPTQRIVDWLSDNFKAIGNENVFEVIILDASLIKIKFENKDATNFDEKINYKYELFFLIEFNLFDDSNNLTSSVLVEIRRSTTSGVYISLQEKERIIDDLIYHSLVDLSLESHQQLQQYMSDFLL